MALYSLLVEHEGESFSTQVAGTSAEEAVRRFFAHPIAKAVSPVLGSTGHPLRHTDDGLGESVDRLRRQGGALREHFRRPNRRAAGGLVMRIALAPNRSV
jgi:predicted trehalose synthase